MFKFACFLIENAIDKKSLTDEKLKVLSDKFNSIIEEYGGIYPMKNKQGRLECFQALKKRDRERKIKAIYEKIKKSIREKYKFCNLYIKGLPNEFSEEQLTKMFELYGTIRSCKLEKKEFIHNPNFGGNVVKLFAYVCFDNQDSASKARADMNGKVILEGTTRLFVDYHQQRHERSAFLKMKRLSQVPIQTRQKVNTNYGRTIGEQNMFPQANVNPPQRKNYIQRNPNPDSKFITFDYRKEEAGDLLYNNLMKNPGFFAYKNLFSKIVGIFLDLEEDIIKRLVIDVIYFEFQVRETIKLLLERVSN